MKQKKNKSFNLRKISPFLSEGTLFFFDINNFIKGNHIMATTKKVYSGPKFDFDAFNGLVKNQPVGTRLFLAEQLIRDIKTSYDDNDNPNFDSARKLLRDVKELRVAHKAQVAQYLSERDAYADNRGRPEMEATAHTNSGDYAA
jgi:hypothetical protein